MGRRGARMPGSPDRAVLAYRQVFETWWVGVPLHFEETLIADGTCWHARDESHSISMSSTRLSLDTGGPVPATDILEQLAPMLVGEPVDDGPPGVLSRAVIICVEQPAVASRALSGLAVADGGVLLTTITSDDIAWARMIWRSIGHRARAAR